MTEQSRDQRAAQTVASSAMFIDVESTVELVTDDGLGWDGSFHAVPQFSTATQVFNFFTEHPPPDSTVFKLRRLGKRKARLRRVAKWQADSGRRIARWDAENPEAEVADDTGAADEEHKATARMLHDQLRERMATAATTRQSEWIHTRRIRRHCGAWVAGSRTCAPAVRAKSPRE